MLGVAAAAAAAAQLLQTEAQLMSLWCWLLMCWNIKVITPSGSCDQSGCSSMQAVSQQLLGKVWRYRILNDEAIKQLAEQLRNVSL
jgi:hypothetical protein